MGEGRRKESAYLVEHIRALPTSPGFVLAEAADLLLMTCAGRVTTRSCRLLWQRYEIPDPDLHPHAGTDSPTTAASTS